MDLSGFVKKLHLPAGWTPPAELGFENLRAHPLSRADLDDDLRAVNSSADLIRRTRGGGWPDGSVDEEYDLTDLIWHEREFRDRTSFAYVVRDDSEAYLGCFYLYPMGLRTTLSETLLGYDVDVSWWVTTEAYERGEYRRVHAALRHWLGSAFPFEAPLLSNAEQPEG